MKQILVVFGHEPWLLPPAIEFIKVLTLDYKFKVDIVYLPSTGIGNYKLEEICNSVHVVDKGKITAQFYFPYWLTSHLKNTEYDILISTDIISLQAVYFATIRNVKQIGFWSFEINYFNKNNLFSLDFLRQKLYPLFIAKMNFILIPSEERRDLFKNYFNYKGQIYIVLNSKRVLDRSVLKTKQPIQFIYSGRISENNYITEIIDSLRFIEDKIILHIAGICDDKGVEIINNALKDSFLKSKIQYHGYLSLNELEKVQDKCHFGFVFYNDLSNISSQFPAPTKLGDYISKGMVVIGSSQSYIKHWLVDKKVGVIIKDISPQAISSAINGELLRYSVKRYDQQKKIFESEYNMNLQVSNLLNNLNG